MKCKRKKYEKGGMLKKKGMKKPSMKKKAYKKK